MAFKKIPLLLITFFLAALPRVVHAQDDVVKRAATQLEKWADKYPQEKVYIQTDKPYYAAGDDLWFKVYITIGPQNMPSALSSAVHVELIDSRDSIKRSLKLPIIAGVAFGDFALSDTLEAGSYRIRAYTTWMRNFGTDYFFDKTFTISSASSNSVLAGTSYKFGNTGGKPTITANIHYQDINGIAYAGKEVSYEVKLGQSNVQKGKGITSDKGDLSISFTNPDPAKFTSGEIISQITTAPKKTFTKIIPVKATSANVDVQFFPEGGGLVYGLPSKIAFKAVGADGLGAAITGNITSTDNQEVAVLKTEHLGMGAFMLVPQPGKLYTANVILADGSKKAVRLPTPAEQGYVMFINPVGDADNILVKLFASESFKGQEISLIAQSGGALGYAAKNTLEVGALVAKIPKSRFPRGIVQITLLNAAGQAVNERVVFINRANELNFATDARSNYKMREKVAMNVTATDPAGKGAIATVSAAVIDETKVPVNANDETTILSSILLTADLKGYIEQPAYYFEGNDTERQKNLDNLMLTQGYRRFEWKQLLADALPPVTFPAERSLQISGRVHTGGNKPVVRGKVSIFGSKGGTIFLDTLTDENGRFVFDNLTFKDSARFVIQARTAKNGKFVDIELDRVTPQVVTANVNAPDVEVSISDTTLDYLKNSKKYFDKQAQAGMGNHNIMLKEVVIREKRAALQNSSNLNGAGNADQVLNYDFFDKFPCPTLPQCLQGRLNFVTFRGDVPYSTRSPNIPMQIIVDGLYVESDFLANISPRDIGSVEVLRTTATTAIYGSQGAGGVLVINTRRGNEPINYSRQYAPGVMTYAPQGFYLARTFYSPQYDDPKVNAGLADLRTTILWQPNIVTDANGKATLSYFNAGSPGNYRVVIEGIDADGHLGHKVVRYNVD